MAHLSRDCAGAIADAGGLDAMLQRGLLGLPHCQLLYVVDTGFRQRSSNVGLSGLEPAWRGQDLAGRPYLEGLVPYRGLVLSPVYLSNRSLDPCITAVYAIQDAQGLLLGFLVADFPVKDLPLPTPDVRVERDWRQYKGDPSIRGLLFQQQRSHNEMDVRIGEVHAVIRTLMSHHGVFHVKLHYSSARVTLWLHSDPYDYQIHGLPDIVDPEICLLYASRPYASEAKVDMERIADVLEQFVELRNADDTVYLRSASLNVMNGRVGLTFSCDGSHYLDADEFLSRRASFWVSDEAKVLREPGTALES